MPYQVQQIIEGKGKPVSVVKDDTVSHALSLMIENDFSQLPVVTGNSETISPETDSPEGMVTYEGILRGIRNFKAKISDLKVRDVMVAAPMYSLEEDLFDILDRLKETNAVLITQDRGAGPNLVGIVTSYDTAEYFRNRTEDLMRVEDIELMVKEFIKAAYSNEMGELNQKALNDVVTQITAYKRSNTQSETIPSFDDLTLGDYISLLLFKDIWTFVEPFFGVQKGFVNELLQAVREIRNALAHFRGDISAEQRDQLKFGAEWLSRCQEEYEAWREKEEQEQTKYAQSIVNQISKGFDQLTKEQSGLDFSVHGSTDFSVTESARGGGRYAALADWLQSQPGKVDQIPLTFNKIEEIINTDLPASARNHRAWWANDSVGHSHSQLWLDAGWRTTYINLSEGKVTFSRIRERERAYINFFSKLLDELRKKTDFPVRNVNPDGASWIVLQPIQHEGSTCGSFNYSFSRDKRLRVELYLDLGEKNTTKSVFDKLYAQRGHIEPEVGNVEWEKLENRRASRIALYHEGHILEEKNHSELRKWAAESMANFYKIMSRLVDHAINEVRNG
jgi:predicted transcriptional regulator